MVMSGGKREREAKICHGEAKVLLWYVRAWGGKGLVMVRERGSGMGRQRSCYGT